jgi:hypothetical protein
VRLSTSPPTSCSTVPLSWQVVAHSILISTVQALHSNWLTIPLSACLPNRESSPDTHRPIFLITSFFSDSHYDPLRAAIKSASPLLSLPPLAIDPQLERSPRAPHPDSAITSAESRGRGRRVVSSPRSSSRQDRSPDIGFRRRTDGHRVRIFFSSSSLPPSLPPIAISLIHPLKGTGQNEISGHKVQLRSSYLEQLIY